MQQLPPRTTDVLIAHELHSFETSESNIPLGRIARTLARYRHVIWLALALLFITCVAGVLAAYLFSPSARITTLPFRLDFRGADRGEYPNGTKFSNFEIVATPILTEVYQRNQLSRFASFDDFSKAVFIVETNKALEQLTREYRAKLSEPRLTAVDRERIEAEYDQKRESLSRSQYSVNLRTTGDTSRIPEVLVPKILNDILSSWANRAAKEKGVLSYRLPVFSRNILAGGILDAEDYIVALDVLRTRIQKVLQNIDDLLEVPGAEVLRTGSDEISLSEIRLKLSDLIRFRIQPLTLRIRSNAGTPDARETLRYLQSQLRYNEMKAQESRAAAQAMLDSMRVYTEQNAPPSTARLGGEGSRQNAETLMPQISDNFLDRIVDLTKEKIDVEYRQDMVTRITDASLETIPYEQEAGYYRQLLNDMQGVNTVARDAAQYQKVRAELGTTFKEVETAIGQVNSLYKLVSMNLNPPTVLFTVTEPAFTWTDRSWSIGRLALYALLTFLVAIPLILGGVLLHSRVVEEERMEDQMVAQPQSYTETREPGFSKR